MELTYTLAGLDCPHCSAKIEQEVGLLDGVRFSAVNLLRQELTIETELTTEYITGKITEIVHKHEPEVVVSQKTDTVTTVYRLAGLDCPHCAAEIEEAVQELPGVQSASVNLVAETLTVQTIPGDLLEKITELVHTHEPEVTVSVQEDPAAPAATAEEETHPYRSTIIRLGIGAVLFAAGLICEHLLKIPAFGVFCVMFCAYAVTGWDVVWQALRNITRGRIFDEHFLMSISTVGAFALGEYAEAAAVMLFYQLGELFQEMAVGRSRRFISALLDIRPDTAGVKRNGEIVTIPAGQVALGETVVVKPGERVPLDGTVISGSSSLNTAALTGESVPRSVHTGDTVLSGCINETGTLEIRVTKVFSESTAAKMIELVENAASRKAPAENFITKFARYYTPVVVGLAAMLALIPPLLLGAAWAEWVRRAFVFLIVSCPCALVISVPLSFFGGIGAASRRGVLVKGSNYLEALSKVTEMVFDKTGTLTEGKFSVRACIPAEGIPAEKLLQTAAKLEQHSNHPIARSITEAAGDLPHTEAENFTELAGLGISGTIGGERILAGNAALLGKEGIRVPEITEAGTRVYIAAGSRYLGCIVIADSLKPGTAEAMKALKTAGIRDLVMLTGDSNAAAEPIARATGMDTVCAELLPADKAEKLEALEKALPSGEKLAYIGDGINDAPVLARADVGIAMGAMGADAAIEAADIVLMDDDPARIAEAVSIARQTKQIVMQNIVLAIGVKVLILILGAFGIAGMWAAVFGDVGVTVLAVLNAMRTNK